MNDTTRIYWLHALTPLHVGTGSGLGYIDLPIMREKVTNWPLVPGSAIKGVLRDWHEQKETDHLDIAFGKAGDEHANSGSLVFTDSRIVCLPVRSMYGTFAWCTSPLVLNRLARDLQTSGITEPSGPASAPGEGKAWTPEGMETRLKGTEAKIFLEDLDLDVQGHPDATAWAEFLGGQLFSDDSWKTAFKERFVILSDNVFDFLCETGTEVNARVRIEDDKKTVARGALWYEEALPAETILGGMVWCDRIFGGNGTQLKPKGLLDTYCNSELDLQIGGKATIGHGRVRCVFTKGGQS